MKTIYLKVQVPEGYKAGGIIAFIDHVECDYTEIQLPTEEDSVKEANRLFEPLDSDFRQGEYSGFRFGYDWLLNKLTQ
jgi:hypothetical protein